MKDIVVFSGSSHQQLAEEICTELGTRLAPSKISRFSNDCLQVQLLVNVRQRDVYIIQPLVPPTQENLVELLMMADAARGASAAHVNAVIPHYAYARSDKKDAPRISIGGRLVADLLATAGVSRVARHSATRYWMMTGSTCTRSTSRRACSRSCAVATARTPADVMSWGLRPR